MAHLFILSLYTSVVNAYQSRPSHDGHYSGSISDHSYFKSTLSCGPGVCTCVTWIDLDHSCNKIILSAQMNSKIVILYQKPEHTHTHVHMHMYTHTQTHTHTHTQVTPHGMYMWSCEDMIRCD